MLTAIVILTILIIPLLIRKYIQNYKDKTITYLKTDLLLVFIGFLSFVLSTLIIYILSEEYNINFSNGIICVWLFFPAIPIAICLYFTQGFKNWK